MNSSAQAVAADVCASAAPVPPRAMPGRWRSGDLPVLSNLPISARFALLVGLALLGAVAFAVVDRVVESRISALLAAQDGFRRLNDLAGDVRARAAAMRNHQEHFLRERDAQAALDFRADAAFIAEALSAMSVSLGANGPGEPMGSLRDGFVRIGQRFDEVARRAEILGLSASDGLRGRLAVSVKAMEDELTMWPNAGPLLPTVLLMRQAEKDFMLYHKDSFLGRHRKYANQFDFELDGSELPESTRSDLRRLVVAYGSDMKAFAEGTQALNADVAALRQEFQAVQPLLGEMFVHARDGMNRAIAEQEATRTRLSQWLAWAAGGAVLLFCLVSLVLARSIVRPVRLIEAAMNRLAQGDHAVVVPGIARRDEIGDMAKAVAVFKDNAVAMVRLQQEQDVIRAEAEAANRVRMLALADHFEQTVKAVAEMVNANAQAIRDTALRMVRREPAGSGGHGGGSLSVAEAAQRSRRMVADVAEAAGDLSASLHEITQHAAAASAVVTQAVAELERTDAQVGGLAQVAGNIDRVVNLISDIAGRTNMLALNATIEAQRAGDAGKGFAVVADEVKHLAQKTADSTREIAEQVAAIQAATAETVAAIGGVSDAIRRMDEIAARVAHAVTRQAEVTGKIGHGVGEVTGGTSEVTAGVVGVTQSAARYCGSAVRMLWAADRLAGPAATLKREVDEFLRTIRS